MKMKGFRFKGCGKDLVKSSLVVVQESILNPFFLLIRLHEIRKTPDLIGVTPNEMEKTTLYVPVH